MSAPDSKHGSPDACCQSVDQHEQAEWNRRTFLRRSIGALIAGSVGHQLLSLVDSPLATGLSAVHAQSMIEGGLPLVSPSPVKSVIVLWMNGGASQLDTFDPKPGTTNGGPFKSINTASKGVQISEHLPNVAEIMDRVALVRCMSTGEGNHERGRHLMRTGFNLNPTVEYPGLGSILSYEQNEAYSKLPQNVAINMPGEKAGILGIPYDPFNVSNSLRKVDNLNPVRGVSHERVDRRVNMLKNHDAHFRSKLGRDEYYVDGQHAVIDDALSLMNSKDKEAFDITEEPKAIKDAYGSGRFGQGCLMARRLVEQGVKYIEVSQNGWDTHQDNFNRSQELMGDLDKGMSALIKDLEQRDLLNSTLIVWMGEFGRTPNINANEGRDHFPSAWSVALAGAHIKGEIGRAHV